MNTIAIHTWDPGVLEGGEKTASSGGASWLKFLIEKLSNEGNTVLWASNNPSDSVLMTTTVSPQVAAKEADILFMPWRWEMPLYPDRNQLFLSQQYLIERGRGKKVVHDEDHMMRLQDATDCVKQGVILTAPELFPKSGFQSLVFPYPFEGKEIEVCENLAMFKTADLMYIGNNYGRLAQTKKYLNLPNSVSVEITGNWMTPHPERETPEQVASAFPNALFFGKVSNDSVVRELSEAITTVHLAKPSYCHTGFVTMRWAEAAAAGIPALVPAEFRLKGPLAEAFQPMFVKSGESVIEMIEAFRASKLMYDVSVERQREAVKKVFSIEPWLDILS